MTSNGPTWPEPPAGPPGQGQAGAGQPPRYPPPGQYPPPAQPAPGQFQPPSQPTQPAPGYASGPDGQTQAVPGYAPQSFAAPHTVGPYDDRIDTGNVGGGPPRPGGGQRALLAGVLGGLVTLGIVTGAALYFSSSDDSGEGDEPEINALVDDPDDDTETVTTPTPSTVDPRIGGAVTGLDLRLGDCINYDTSSLNIDTFDVVTCGTPHLAEITAQPEHPDAGGGFPGVNELHNWANEQCRSSTSDFIGTDVQETTLDATTLVPDFDEWGEGLTSVSCLVRAADGSRLIESVAGKGASYPRSSDLAVNRLRAGDCFVPGPTQTAYELGVSDVTMLAPCDGPHDGLFFGRATLDFPVGAVYPGQEAVEDAAIELCNEEFTRYFGVSHEGLNYRFWSPDEALWNSDDRGVLCAVLDENGLPSSLDYASFRPMYQLPIGQCFTFGPEETTDLMRLDDQVLPVDCSDQHNGELFGFDELPPTSDAFPGVDPLDAQISEECIALFVEYVGISPFESESGDFIYWYPNETGWESGDLRWACALLTDEPRTGSIEGANA